MNTINVVRKQKSAIRKEMRNLLKQIPINMIERESAIVSDKVLTSKEYLNSKKISVYLSMPNSEISTKAIIHDIFQKDKICYVPRWNEDAMDMVRLLSYQDYISLPVNRWNIPEPSHDYNYEIATELDLIIMPGLAFDLQRNRLGHGKGYYDKYLAKCKNWVKENNRQLPKTMALSLESQLCKDKLLPTCIYDQKLDFIITPYQIIM
ncbi:hypothetical protein Glove_26g94 [Diversispora epigaea]|uniref:5-formyltetrahydrofolate cyclo-ligase n=1 Tax=Diversispora epigaea TaxID=1348612 RepID=A0A397JPU3_9GLOM|nr:hypothetical protein Glove_26g94 [Diversispora epigaea]